MPRERHKKQLAVRGQFLSPKTARHGDQSRAQPKSGHSCASVQRKLAPLTLTLTQAPLSPVLDELSTSVIQHSTNTISVLTTPEVFATAKDFQSLSVPVSPALQESAVSVPVIRMEPVGSGHHSILGPLVPSKGKLAMLALVQASSPQQRFPALVGTAPPWSPDRDLSSLESEVKSYFSHSRSHPRYSLRHSYPSNDPGTEVPLSVCSGYHWVHLCQYSGTFGSHKGFPSFPELTLGIPSQRPQNEGHHHPIRLKPVWTPVPSPAQNYSSQLNGTLPGQKGRKSVHDWC